MDRISNEQLGTFRCSSIKTNINKLESLFNKGCYPKDKDFEDDEEKVSFYMNLQDEFGKLSLWLYKTSSFPKNMTKIFSVWYENEKSLDSLLNILSK